MIAELVIQPMLLLSWQELSNLQICIKIGREPDRSRPLFRR
jgi:hypothetical protein